MRLVRSLDSLRPIVRVLLAAAIVLSLCTSPVWAQDEEEDDLDDLFGDEEIFVDEFDESDAPAKPKERGALYWAFDVPADLLILRPVAFVDTAVGLAYFGLVSQLQLPMSLVGAAIGYAEDGEWYVDQGNLDQTWQQLVNDPFEYLATRPLGEFSSY